jgi:hypothetical protein
LFATADRRLIDAQRPHGSPRVAAPAEPRGWVKRPFGADAVKHKSDRGDAALGFEIGVQDTWLRVRDVHPVARRLDEQVDVIVLYGSAVCDCRLHSHER